MKRTLLVLAILALGGGCGSSCDTPGTITFYWQFAGPSGRVVGTFDVDDATTPFPDDSCFVDGVPFVDTIDITVDGITETVNCSGPNRVPGARLPGFFRGAHAWTIDAFRGSQLVFTGSGSTSARTCNDSQELVTLQAVTPQDLVVYYDVNGAQPDGCGVGGIGIANVVYQLRNGANRIADSSCIGNFDSAGVCSQEGSLACDPLSLGFTSSRALPLGPYTMSYLELNGLASTVPLAAICGSQPGAQFVHDGFPVFLNLTAPVASACPAPGPANP